MIVRVVTDPLTHNPCLADLAKAFQCFVCGAEHICFHLDEIDFLRSDEKYTLIAWRGDQGKPGEALNSTPLKGLVAQLDAAQFVQVHRWVVVDPCAISQVTRGDNETARIHLKGHDEVLPVSRSDLHLFRQM